jgi:hypothetical protein
MSEFILPSDIQSRLVENVEVDFTNYQDTKDFIVLAEYVNSTTCNIIVKRLDTTNPNEGWNEDLQVLFNTISQTPQTLQTSQEEIHIITIGPSPESNMKITRFETATTLYPRTNTTTTDVLNKYPSYNTLQRHYIHYRSLEEFNDIFQTDIVRLPANMFAIGMKEGQAYKHHDPYGGYPWTYEIDLTLNHIISVAYNKTPTRCPDDFYFLVCSHDGYMERYYPSPRTKPYIPKPDEYRNQVWLTLPPDEENSYPLLHKYKLVLGQSIHPDTAHTIAVPDRYYFCLNRYNLYHGVHRGIPFHKKISQVVFACNPRGDKYNFTTRRDIEMNPREYLKTVNVPKDNIHCPEQIAREDMINYKYILDIDGNASTWDATAWKLNSGSVIFKSDSNWVQWFYDEYKPWIHYIPIADDFSDIQEKFNWCEDNPERCLEITQNAKRLFQKIYRHHNVVKYTEDLLEKWDNA